MSLKSNNENAVKNGMKYARMLIQLDMMKKFENAAVSLLEQAFEEAEFRDLTGNTITSYCAGIFLDGKLIKIVSLAELEGAPNPTRKKLSKKDKYPITLERYISGIPATISGVDVDTDGGYGLDTSKRFLSQYKPSVQKGYGIVVTTGTEYSEFLEAERHLNVLTDNLEDAKKVVKNHAW